MCEGYNGKSRMLGERRRVRTTKRVATDSRGRERREVRGGEKDVTYYTHVYYLRTALCFHLACV